MDDQDRINRVRAEIATLQRRLAQIAEPASDAERRMQAVLRNRLELQRKSLETLLAHGRCTPLAVVRERLQGLPRPRTAGNPPWRRRDPDSTG